MASMSGMKIATSNRFDALHMDDSDDFGIPTNEVTKDLNSGIPKEAKEDV